MSNTPADIADFFKADSFVLFGESPNRKTFATAIKKELEKSGRRVISMTRPAGGKSGCESIPKGISDRAIISMGKNNTVSAISRLKDIGITRVFLQNGSFDDGILTAFRKSGIDVCTGCALMYLPTSGGIHRFHRWLHSLFAR